MILDKFGSNKYTPNYSKEKLDVLRRYVENFMKNVSGQKEQLAASVVSEGLENINVANLKARYDFFNNLFFKGELPTYSVKFKIIRDNSHKALGSWTDSESTIRIYINLINTDYSLDTILVHEMCHIWQDRIWQGKVYSDHGRSFQYIKNRVNKESNGRYEIRKYENIDKFDGIWKTNTSKINKTLKPFKLVVKDLSKSIYTYNNDEVIYNFDNQKFEGRYSKRNRASVELNRNEKLLDLMYKIYYKIETGDGVK